MATQTSGGSTTSFGNTPQANNDIFTFTEEANNILILNVMANDLGGAAKTLFSLDDGTSTSASTKSYAPADLLVKDVSYSSDAAGAAGTSDHSALGARIWIESDGTVHYDKGDINSLLQGLAVGQTLNDSFTYAIQLGNGTLSWATVTLQFSGANDSVYITSSPQSGAVVEDAATTPAPSDSLTAAGTISFTDADLSDTHTASFVASPTNTTSLGMFSLDPGNEAANAADGSVQWHYALNSAAAQYLAQGQSVAESYVVTVNDGHGSTTTQTVTVTITGTNDAPVITAQDLSGAVTELVTPAGNLADSGTISFTDVDLTDVHLVSATGTPIGSVLGSLTAVKDSDTTGTGTGGQLTWTYTVAASAVEYLAAGQTKVESFTITLDDQNGGLITKQIDVTITGTNDAPVITAQDLSGAVTELVTPAGNLADSGTISFTDVDLTDVHLVSATGTPIGSVLGSLTAVKDSDTTGTGTGGQLTWTYTVAASAVEYLAAGQTKVESFTITLDDQNGGLITKQIDVTITGTNDAPVITAQDLSGAVTELVTPAGNLADSGTISFTDVDLTDVHLVSATGTPIGSVLGSLTAVKDSDTTGTGTGGQLTWTYTVAASAVEYLAAGQTKVESFTITLDDQNGGLITKQIDVTITGTNDAPVITAQDLSGAVTELVTPAGNLADSGTISFTDVDLTDVHLVSATGTPIGSVLGSLTAVKDSDTTGTGTGGQLTWTYTVAASAVEYLAAGQTKVESFTITLDDQNGGLITKQIDVTITGTNDAPVITAQGGSLSYTENQAATAIDTALLVSDVDSPTLIGATVSITGNFASGQDVLDFTNQNGITGSYNASTGLLTLSGTTTVANYQAALRSVAYFNSSDNPSGASRTISYQVDDGSASNHASNVATATVAVTSVNDAPTLTATASSPAFTEGAGSSQAAAVTVFSGTSISTVEAGQTIKTLKFTVSGLVDGANEKIAVDSSTFSLTNGTSGTTTGGNSLGYSVSVSGATATVTLTSAAGISASTAQTVVNGIAYQDTNINDPTAGTRTVTLTSIQDSGGTANGGTDTTGLSIASNVTVTPVNDAPTLTATASSPTFTEGAGSSQAAAVTVFSGTSISTVEAGQTIKGLTLTVGGLVDGSNEKIVVDGTTFSLTNGTAGTTSGGNSLGYSVSVSGATATVTLTSAGGISTSAAQTVVNGIAYQDTNVGNPTAGARTITLTSIQDSGGTANGGVDIKSLSTFAELTGSNNPLNGVDVGDYANPAFVDLNGDGKLDVVIGADNGTLLYYRNTGTATAPAYVQEAGPSNPFNTVDIGLHADPTFVDLDGDGDLDAVVGEFGATLLYFKNTGTATAPVFTQQTGANNPFNGITVGGSGSHYSAPVFADLDGDGDKDAVVGAQDGTLYYFKNTGTASAPVFTAQSGANNPFNGITVGSYSNPTLLDVDGDGKLDVVVGASDGTLHYLRNVGTSTAPAFVEQTGSNNPFNGLDFGDFSGPTFVDIDGDGKPDAFIGTSNGQLHYLHNVTASSTVNVFAVNDAPVNSIPGAQGVGINTSFSFSSANGSAVSISDVDVGAGSEKVTLSVSHGTLTLSTTSGLSFTAGDGTSDASMTFSGTITSINNALNGLVYTPTASFTGTDTFTITTDDQGSTGSGGALSDTDNVTINVQNTALTSGPDILTFTAGTNSVTATNNTLNNGDKLTGGTGVDTLTIPNNQPGPFTFGDGTGSTVGVRNFEKIVLNDTSTGTHTDTVTFAASFSNGSTITIDGTPITGNAKLSFDASATSNAFVVLGGSNNDTIVGGSGNDIFIGKSGNDTLTGNGGADQFRLQTNGGTDVITDYTQGTDKIGLLGGAALGGVSFTNTSASAAGTTLNSGDFNNTRTSIAGINAADDNHVDVLTSSQTTSNITTNNGGAATNAYVIVFNSTTGHGEIWFDTDWSNTANRVQVATLSNIMTLAGVTAITNTDLVVYDSTLGPAGVAGSSMNMGLLGSISGLVGPATIALDAVPADWVLSGGIQSAGSWTIQTNDLSSVNLNTPVNFTGAALLNVTVSWSNADGSAGLATLQENIEVYAPGTPIFALSGDDHLTGHPGSDLFVFSQPIGKDVVHSFEVSSDVIDLISYGWQSFADVQAHTADDTSGNAVITLADGQTITLDGVHAADLTAANFEFDVTPTVDNPGAMTIGDGAMLPLSGIIHNTGEIDLQSSGDDTLLQLIQTGIKLEGGGLVTLSDDDHNIIAGTASNVTLDNVDNVISGAGQIGQGSLTLSNERTIDATGTHALVIDTGANVIANAGTLEATGAGGLVLESAVANSGMIWANGGTVTAEGEVTGSGNALISGAGTIEFGAGSTAGVTFDVTAAGHLILDDAFHFSGAVSGLDGNDDIGIKGIAFGAATTVSFTENEAGTGGTLTVSDGAHTANIILLGQYDPTGFSTKGDATNDAVIAYDPHHIA
ncbi:VCBS domain-containing protein [Bradyrhizobium sp. C-145]|uniref:beta strand repeat-containing protein n=1 Tax=Bradyrhizobium sp. C-145 TaxID=574727 RepID=UPI00201B65C2|nr:VCBS domain-containing protein [Bradyrhizobium sp. C-145]UQR61116.1 VCBS domain-containing protein [Bradyrhizobium sp. C-145]